MNFNKSYLKNHSMVISEDKLKNKYMITELYKYVYECEICGVVAVSNTSYSFYMIRPNHWGEFRMENYETCYTDEEAEKIEKIKGILE